MAEGSRMIAHCVAGFARAMRGVPVSSCDGLVT
jgi:hypothetical protein